MVLAVRSMHGRILILGLALLVLLAIAGAGLALLWQDWQRFAAQPLVDETAQPLEIPRGLGFNAIVTRIRTHVGDAAPRWYWRLLAEQLKVANRLHAGEYALPAGITPRQLLLDMAAGRVMQHRFTIVDGWTFRQLRAALARVDGLQHSAADLPDDEVARLLDVPDGHPEGWFLPETYLWVKGDSDLDVLRRAHKAMLALLDELWPQRDPASPAATRYEALILASIIEKETGIPEERGQIAGVFARRLKLGMRLQTDPTVVYGAGDSYDGVIRRSHLDTDTPYNTYTRDGLPPTPIAMPGRPALQAALHPQPGDSLYFVARGDGGHIFSATLREHNRAVARYRALQRQ